VQGVPVVLGGLRCELRLREPRLDGRLQGQRALGGEFQGEALAAEGIEEHDGLDVAVGDHPGEVLAARLVDLVQHPVDLGEDLGVTGAARAADGNAGDDTFDDPASAVVRPVHGRVTLPFQSSRVRILAAIASAASFMPRS